MIYVDGLMKTPGAFWHGKMASKMISDESREDLEGFAASIGIPTFWYRPWFFPHYQLSPKWRKKALGAGAVDCGDLHAGLTRYAEAMRRFRQANPYMFPEGV